MLGPDLQAGERPSGGEGTERVCPGGELRESLSQLACLQAQESHGQHVFAFNRRFEGKRAREGLISFPLLPPRRAKAPDSTESRFLFAHAEF